MANPASWPQRFRGIAKSGTGTIAVMFALMVGALAGIMALAMDLGKAWNLDTELQNAADACAVAGATQLDGLDGARERAIKACSDAVSKMVQNNQIFATDGSGTEVTFDPDVAVDPASGKTLNGDIKFYSAYPLDPSVEATSDAEARFIEANVVPHRVDFAFAAAVGAVSSTSPTARAVAGFETYYCDTPPMMMCNPSEPAGGWKDAPFNIYESCGNSGTAADSCVGRTISMKTHSGGGNAKLGPGDWGYLSLDVYDPQTGTTTTLSGAGDLADALASVEYNSICTGNEITTRPGNVASLDRFINQRFDLYWDSTDMSIANHQPARQTERGLVPKSATWNPTVDGCRFNPIAGAPTNPGVWDRPTDKYIGPGQHVPADISPADGIQDVSPFDPTMGAMTPPIRSMAFPKDYCAYPAADVASGLSVDKGVEGCRPIDGGIQMGSGQYDVQTYLDVYHPGVTKAQLLTPCPPSSPPEAACGADLPNSLDPYVAPDNKLSRWEIYNWEKKAVDLGTSVDYPNMPYEGKPECYKAPGQMGQDYVLPETPATAATVDRRVIVMAVVNCVGWDVKGKATVERTKPHGDIGVFLTEPMGLTDPDTMYGEIVDPHGLGIDDPNNDLQLVRERVLLIE